VNAEPGTVRFAISFDPFGYLVIAEAGPNALATFDLSRPGIADHAAPVNPCLYPGVFGNVLLELG
jgi:hypothetical protein